MKTSLVISTYNNPNYLKLCLRTILAQTRMPSEVVIADDGSGLETKQLIDEFAAICSIPVVHVWHEDDGFRKCAIMNKAIARCTGDYILQIDGDVLLDRHFVEDHLTIAQEGHWVNGSRVLLEESVTKRIMGEQVNAPLSQPFNAKSIISIRNMPLSSVMNSLRIKWLRNYMKNRYAIKKVDHMRGCNMAFFRSDAIAVNGYNEDLTSWGHEDGELVFRLHFNGVKKLSLKMGGNVFHMHHKQSSRDNESTHLHALEEVKSKRLSWCYNGIDKYL